MTGNGITSSKLSSGFPWYTCISFDVSSFSQIIIIVFTFKNWKILIFFTTINMHLLMTQSYFKITYHICMRKEYKISIALWGIESSEIGKFYNKIIFTLYSTFGWNKLRSLWKIVGICPSRKLC